MKTPLAVAAGLLLAVGNASARELPNYDALSDVTTTRTVASPQNASRPFAKVATVAHTEDRLGLPTFVWAAHDQNGKQPWVLGDLGDLKPQQAARRYLLELSELYHLNAAQIQSAHVKEIHDTGFGGRIVRFTQTVDGVEVFRDELNVLLDRSNHLVAVTGYLSPLSTDAKHARDNFRLTPQSAIVSAFQDFTGEVISDAALTNTEELKAGYSYFKLNPAAATQLSEVPTLPFRIKPVLFSLPGSLEAAYYVELKTANDSEGANYYFSYVVSARDGRVMFRNNLTAHAAASYKVWADSTSLLPYDGPKGNAVTPHPTGTPNGYNPAFVSPNVITLDSAPFSKNDPWLPAGATTTSGNNVKAYADIASPDGFSSGDVIADPTSAMTFDRLYDVTQNPDVSSDQRKAAVTQLFYNDNFFHDWYYDFGFDEQAGNAQVSNYNRGGVGGDPILAEAQDYSGTDNANMQTPADGASPVMQMYLFTAPSNLTVTVTAPSSIAGTLQAEAGTFGTQTYNLSGTLKLADDGVAPGEDACTALPSGSLTGKIALVVRGGSSSCRFSTKAINAQNAGAVAVIIYNNVSGPAPQPFSYNTSITIPVIGITDAAGAQLKSALSSGTVTMSLVRAKVGVDHDGALDNSVVAHEWGHYIQGRLIGNGNGLNTNQAGGMGEGWSDFHAMLMVVAESDTLRNLTPPYSGVYPLATYASESLSSDAYYFGIRRVPYSTNFSVDPLTFKHITDGVTLPSTAPIFGGTDGSYNSEVHNTGEVWCTMLWESYAALLNDTTRLTFDQARTRMKNYIVAGYKLTPINPTFVEARDAILAAANAADQVDFTTIAQAFARRGMGTNAVAPSKSSQDNSGVVEDFNAGPALSFVDMTVADDVTTCDADGHLDNNETGTLTIRIKNVGTAALTQTTGTVSSTLSNVTFPNGAALTFPNSTPGQVVSTTVHVALSGLTGRTQMPLSVSFTDPDLSTPGNVTGTTSVRVNYDELPKSSLTDDVEGTDSVWSLGHDGSLGTASPFARAAGNGGTVWHGPDADEPEDQWLASPLVQVSPAGNFSITFKHRYAFEKDAQGNYDGAVIEVKEENQTNWVDVGGLATPGYNGTILDGQQTRFGFYPSENPLHGRQGFVGKNTGYPGYITTTVNLGTTYAGKKVQFRFRVGSDTTAFDSGWDIDDITFSGISSTPFATITDQGPVCNNKRPVANAGSSVTVNEGESVTLSGTATDAENAAMTYTWTQVSGPQGVLANETTLTPTFTAPSVNDDQAVTLQFVASDGVQQSIPSQVQIVVKNINHAPVAVVTTPIEAVAGATVTLDASGSSDPDGDPIAFNWKQISGLDVTLSAPDTTQVTFTAPSVPAGTQLLFSLEAYDPSMTSNTAVAVVTIVDAQPVDETPKDTTQAPKGCGCNGSGVDVSATFALAGLAMMVMRRRMKR